MTDPRSPLDAALDLLVYVPVGLALAAVEEIPKLAAKGHAQLDGRLSMAKVVGKFAVAQGRKEFSRRFSTTSSSTQSAPAPSRSGASGLGDTPVGGSRPARAASVDAALAADPASGVVGPGGGPLEDGLEDLLVGSGPLAGRPDARIGEATTGTATSAPPGVDVDPAGVLPEPGVLAIPGYDSLAASQVVQRLAGLAPAELAAVGAYEASHRARRTVLTRVRQLQER